MTPPRIIDAFTFSTELDLLELRLGLLYDVVDRFVLVEATRTHSGNDKPLEFDANRARFAPYLDKIEHVIVDDLPDPTPDRWVPENFQRNAIARGLEGLDPNDILLVGDLDEIPNPSVIQLLRRECPDVITIELRMCFFRPNLEVPGQTWRMLRATRLRALTTPQELRDSEPSFVVRDGGAHLSYLMDGRTIARKFETFSHAELDTDRWRSPDFLVASIESGVFTPYHLLLTRRDDRELTDVQLAANAAMPEFDDQRDLPAPWIRRLFCKYSRLRVNPRLPQAIVGKGDRWFRRLIER